MDWRDPMATGSPGAVRGRNLTLPSLLALIFGVVYTLVGIVGFFVTGFDHFAAHSDDTLLGFELNPLHNIVHILVGVAGIVASRQLSTTRLFGWVLFGAFAVVFLFGLFAAGDPDINFLSINAADNVLHLITALAGLAIALLPAQIREAV